MDIPVPCTCNVLCKLCCTNCKNNYQLIRLDAPAIGRIQLDEALQLRGNFLLGGVGNACIGCVIWQKCFYILQKLAATLACFGFLAACTPWAFQNLLNSLDLTSLHYATVRRNPKYVCLFHSAWNDYQTILFYL